MDSFAALLPAEGVPLSLDALQAALDTLATIVRETRARLAPYAVRCPGCRSLGFYAFAEGFLAHLASSAVNCSLAHRFAGFLALDAPRLRMGRRFMALPGRVLRRNAGESAAPALDGIAS